jgi:hypothetical protein
VGNLDTMNTQWLLRNAKTFYYLVKQAGLVNDYIGPVLRNPNPNDPEKLNLAQRLDKTIKTILQEAAKEEPYPSGWVQASELKINGPTVRSSFFNTQCDLLNSRK